MKLIIGALLLVIFANCASSKNQLTNNTSETIFRYAHINLTDSLILGNSIYPLLIYGEKLNEYSHRIPISYPGTASITSYFDSDSIITDMVFTYRTVFDFRKSLSDYASDFGSPLKTQLKDYTLFSWFDGETSFDLVKFYGNGDTLFYSVLSDHKMSVFKKEDYQKLTSHRVAPSIRDILSRTEIWSFIGSLNSEIKKGLSGKLQPEDSIRVYGLIDDHFDSKALYKLALEYLSKEIDRESQANLTEWLFSDWAIEQDYIVKKYEPQLTIEEFAESLQSNRPSQERVFTMLEFVQANKAGEFFLNIEEAKEKLTSQILNAASGSKINFESVSGKQREDIIQQYNFRVLVSFLWAMEPLTNEQILKSTTAYKTESGELFVNAYSEAIIYMIDQAGKNLLQEVTRSN